MSTVMLNATSEEKTVTACGVSPCTVERITSDGNKCKVVLKFLGGGGRSKRNIPKGIDYA